LSRSQRIKEDMEKFIASMINEVGPDPHLKLSREAIISKIKATYGLK